MTARAEGGEGSAAEAIVVLVLLFLGISVLCSLGAGVETLEQAAPSSHAVERHGEDAWTAASWVEAQGPGCCYACADGRTRCACRMPDGKFAVAVFEGDRMVTSFLSRSENYIRNMLRDRGCERR